MAGELDATLMDIVADRAPEAAVALAREVHWVNARRLCEALERVGPANFILDLLQHGMEPWQRRARYPAARAPGEIGEQLGRASVRERVCHEVEVSVGAVYLTKKI